MSYEASQPLKIALVAGADLSAKQYHFIKLSAETVVICTAATDIPIGVLQNKPTSGQAAEIVIVGVTKIVADATLATVGSMIGTSADGQADLKINGTDATEYVAGRTLTAAGAAGDIITCVVNCVAPHLSVTAN